MSNVRGQVLNEGIARALESLAEVEDPRNGIRERFIRPSIGGGSTVAVLATPLGERRSTGWVICHSYGMEQVNLATHEVPVARGLASAGFPVIRYHGQGYGDSQLPADGVGIASHLRDALDAAGVLAEATGVGEVGFLGARLGGTIAALAADRSSAASLVAWEPVVRGTTYARSLRTLSVMLQLMHQQRSPGAAPDPERELEERGVLDVQGFPLSREMHEELLGLDLTERLGAFAGRSLVVQISRGAEPRPELERLTGRLRELGGSSELAVVVDERANTFAEPRFRPVGRGHKADIQAELGAHLLARTIEWCATEPDPSAGVAR